MSDFYVQKELVEKVFTTNNGKIPTTSNDFILTTQFIKETIMAKEETTSPDLTGISLKVDDVVVGHLVEINPIVDKSRSSKKYTPLNENEYKEVVAMGALQHGAFSATVLYDPDASDGINLIETAIDDNTTVVLKVELNNRKTTTGTTYVISAKVSSFKVDGEVEGKLKASFSAEIIGTPVVTAAV